VERSATDKEAMNRGNGNIRHPVHGGFPFKTPVLSLEPQIVIRFPQPLVFFVKVFALAHVKIAPYCGRGRARNSARHFAQRAHGKATHQ
jgi:hypothetical protein